MTFPAGARLGSFEILAPIGAGGMGEVYRARDRKLDRDVAIKVLPEAIAADPGALARFEREAKSIAALSHPNILAIFDFGVENGVAYAVMELLEGETLRSRLAGGPIPTSQAVDWALQIARGLAAAHEKSIVHRDLKPENVFVTRDGNVKILDFGLAKRVEPAEPSAPDDATVGADPASGTPTEPGTVLGTAGYMSPEQVRGLAVDQRSDIFSFGAILYEMLSGSRAFRRETPSDSMAAILRDEPAPLADLERPVPAALEHVVRHCLEKDRANRFQTARDVAFALGEASSSAAAAAQRSQPAGGRLATGSTFATAAAPVHRRKQALVALTLAVLAAASAGILWWRSGNRSGASASKAQLIAVLPFENQGDAADDYFVDGMADAVRGKLVSVRGIEVIARASSTPYRKTTKSQQQIAHELGTRYLLTATVRWAKSGGASRVQVSPELVEVSDSGPPTSRWQESFDAALTDVFRVQSDISSRVALSLGVALGAVDKKRLSVTPTGSLTAYDLFLKGRQAGVGSDIASQRRALALYEQAVALDPGFAEAWAAICHGYSYLYANSAPAPESSRRAREAAEKAIALAPDKPDGYLALGSYERLVANDLPGARENFRKAERIAPGAPGLLAGIAFVEQQLGRWKDALEHLREAERLDPRSSARERQLGETLVRLHRYKEGRQAIDAGLALTPRELGLIEEKALSFLGEGDLEGARRVVRAAPKEIDPAEIVSYFAKFWDLVWVLDDAQRELLFRLTPSAFDDDRAGWAISLAQAAALQKDPGRTAFYAEEARKAVEDQLRATPDDPDLHALRGLALAYLGRKEDAVRAGERAVSLQPVERDALFGPYLEHQLIRIHIVNGEPDKALDRLERLLRIPYYLSPGRLRIDPNFDPLRSQPRFRKLAALPG